jgi:hypothetical protein
MDSDASRATINFDKIARRIFELTDLGLIREQLILVWNARGDADMAKIESEWSHVIGATVSGPHMQNINRALRRLDR